MLTKIKLKNVWQIILEPFNVMSCTAHIGTQSLEAGFLKLTERLGGRVRGENADGKRRWIVCVYETDGHRTMSSLQLFKTRIGGLFRGHERT